MTKTDELDAKTLKLKQEVERRKAEISRATRASYRTNCSFSYNNGNRAINLQVVSDVEDLVKIAAFLIRQEKDYNDAALKLGIETPAFLWDSFSVEDWLEDIKTRAVKIQITTKRRQLEKLEKRLDNLMSQELRAKMELEEIEKELS